MTRQPAGRRRTNWRSAGRRYAVVACAALMFACGPQNSAGGDAPAKFEALAQRALAQIDGTVTIPGLRDEVEIRRDRWGVPHIYATNDTDLFFAQGFVLAQDRLWQMEMSRRIAQGRVAEIMGPAGVPHDRLVRLLKYRGPFDDREWSSYHPDARRIFTAYAAGINAFMAQAGDNLPVEFVLTGIRPEPWAPEDILYRARMSAAIQSARRELRLAQDVARFGAAEANRRAQPDPWGELRVPAGLDVGLISDDVIRALDGDMYGDFPRPELVAPYRDWPGGAFTEANGAPELSPGSNNWAISAGLTASSKALMIDDPHREVTLPAWRYVIHLEAPGWRMIGATEPGLPGVIRGHNGRVAWGRTATGTDEADVFVEKLNPANAGEMEYRGAWEPFETLTETIAVKGEAPRTITIKIGRHGPIFYEDKERNLAYALRSSLQEPGTAEYLGGLRLDQAMSARDCLTESRFLHSPPTNLVCADADGHIAFRVSAAAPRRRGWDGRLPVPGTGAFEWEGLRDDLPEEYNPARGWIATANNNIHPPGFKDPLFFHGRPPYWRQERISEQLSRGRQFTTEDARRLLLDVRSVEAERLADWFRGWTAATPDVERARVLVAEWDHDMKKGSAAAAIFRAWRQAVDMNQLRAASTAARQPLVEAGLATAVTTLAAQFGADMNGWRWGRMHQSVFKHPLVAAYDLPTIERDGGAETVNATGSVYRLITDFSDLDRSLVTIAPGQSGQPGSPFYANLLEPWSRGEFFPLAFTRNAVDRETVHRLVLRPTPASGNQR